MPECVAKHISLSEISFICLLLRSMNCCALPDASKTSKAELSGRSTARHTCALFFLLFEEQHPLVLSFISQQDFVGGDGDEQHVLLFCTVVATTVEG